MTESKFKGKQYFDLSIRINPLLYQTLKEKAKKHNLTISGEINFQIHKFKKAKKKKRYFRAYINLMKNPMLKSKRIHFYLASSLYGVKEKINSKTLEKILAINVPISKEKVDKEMWKKERANWENLI